MPGPDSLYIMSRSVSQGFRAGSSAALGIGTGTLIHILAAAFGLSAILTTSATAFIVVKAVGCIYLCYLGLSMLVNKKTDDITRPAQQKNIPLSKIFYQGFLTNILNPKVALFFLAFVPQFISREATNVPLSFIFLGVVFNINSMIYCHFLAWSSSSFSLKIKDNSLFTKVFNGIVGSFLLVFGIKLLFSNYH